MPGSNLQSPCSMVLIKLLPKKNAWRFLSVGAHTRLSEHGIAGKHSTRNASSTLIKQMAFRREKLAFSSRLTLSICPVAPPVPVNPPGRFLTATSGRHPLLLLHARHEAPKENGSVIWRASFHPVALEVPNLKVNICSLQGSSPQNCKRFAAGPTFREGLGVMGTTNNCR